MHVKDLIWVVIEDGEATNPHVERLLRRTQIPHVYLYTTTKPGLPSKYNRFAPFLRKILSIHIQTRSPYVSVEERRVFRRRIKLTRFLRKIIFTLSMQ